MVPTTEGLAMVEALVSVTLGSPNHLGVVLPFDPDLIKVFDGLDITSVSPLGVHDKLRK